MTPDSYQIGEWTVEPAHGRLSRGDEIVHLEPRVMDLLTFLADRAGEVVNKQEILDHVWDHQVVSESALNRAMTKLRKALGDTAAEPTYVQTIPRRGYCLVAPVELAGPEGSTATWALLQGTTSLLLALGSVIIGRSPESDVHLQETRASRRHARLDVCADGVTLTDLGSKNGTFVNARRIDRPTPLLNGDEIGIAGENFILCDLLSAPTETDHQG